MLSTAYCQKDITKQISKAKADYILTLKNNHKTLYEDVSLWLNTQFDNEKLTIVETIEKDHGRLETRRYAISTQLQWLQGKDQWANLNAVVMVESMRKIKSKTTTERRYDLTSLTDLTIIADTIAIIGRLKIVNIGCLMSSLGKMFKKA